MLWVPFGVDGEGDCWLLLTRDLEVKIDTGLKHIQRIMSYRRKENSLAFGLRCWVGCDLPPIQSKKIVWEEACILPKTS